MRTLKKESMDNKSIKAINELILNSEVIKKIKDNPDNVWEYLNQEPPSEWVMEGLSETTGEVYKYLSISTLEFLMETVFTGFDDKIVHQSITSVGNSIIVTMSVELIFTDKVRFITCKKSGTASVTVMDNFYFDKEGKIKFYNKGDKKPIKAAQLLRTATPLCFTEAKKNAIKNICNLFGRNLNRDILEYVPSLDQEEVREKIPADMIIKKKYENAVKKGDEKIIHEIESNYSGL